MDNKHTEKRNNKVKNKKMNRIRIVFLLIAIAF